MRDSRVRYLLALLLGLLSLWATLHFSRIYAAHRLWLGLCATAVLGLLLGTGILSFAAARRRLLRELQVLQEGPPPPSSLAGRRRAQLVALKARGGRPDATVLAQSAAAEIGQNAYLGRYFVAVAVLVGLLGTFAGLMETLGGVSALLQKDMGQSLQSVLLLLSAPLSGLDVTFGASMVGILVTVTLSLLQGDLGLLDDELLAALEEHTVHVLLPSLWPADREPAVLLLGEVAALRLEVSRAVARVEALHRSSLSDHVSAAAAQISGFTSEIAAQLLAHVSSTAEVLSRHAADGAAQIDLRLRQSNEALSAQARRTAATVEQAVLGLGERVANASTEASAQATAALSELLAALRQAEQQRLGDHEELRGRLEAFLTQGIEGPVAQHLSAWQEAAHAAAESARRAEHSALALEQAAQQFSAGTSALLPLLETLGPELHALSAEVALLSERSEGQLTAEQPQLLAELMRLTEGIERLERRLSAQQDPQEAHHAPPWAG